MSTITVMTFNLRGSFFEIDGENYWPHRADLNVRTVTKYNPDLIGFQEFQTGNQETYASVLSDYDHEMGPVTIDNSEFGMWNPIYWKKARFERLDSGSFYLSETPDEWSLSWDSSMVRAATWVHLKDMQSDKTFFMLNTHLDHLGESSRVNGARLIVEKLAGVAGDLPAIVTGDFNSRVWAIEHHGGSIPEKLADEATPAGTVHRVFSSAWYRDTYLEAGGKEGPETNTFHNFKGMGYPAIGQRIDWVLVRGGLTALACDIIRDGEPPLYPSDHYPVMATLSAY